MSRFGPDPRAFFDSVYRQTPPWDVGGAQPAMAALLDEHPPAGPVLDLGCGSGDLALEVARRGLPVLGIDFVQAAVEQAQERARQAPPEVARLLDFQVADALRPTRLGRRFGTVLDSGFFHLLVQDACDRLVEEVGAVLLPGGRYYLHEFAVEFAIPNTPRKVEEAELRARFTEQAGWRILALRPAGFLNRVGPPVPAVAACIQRLPANEESPGG